MIKTNAAGGRNRFSKAFACICVPQARETAATSKSTRTFHACALENLVKKYKITSLLILPLYDQINSLCFNHINQKRRLRSACSSGIHTSQNGNPYFPDHRGSMEVIEREEPKLAA